MSDARIDLIDKNGRPCFKPGAVVVAPSIAEHPLTIVERVCGKAGFSHYVAVDPDGRQYDVADTSDLALSETTDPEPLPSPPGSRLAKPGGAPS